MATDRTVSSFNLPNALTTLRILLVPVFIWLLLAGGTFGTVSEPFRWAAFAFFAVAMYTDKLDGDIARSRGIVTNFGKIADPIADKFLTGAAFIVFSAMGELWWWITILILVREWGITFMRLALIKRQVMPASRGGKLKTVLQTAGIGFLLIPLAPYVGDWWPWVGWIFIGLSAIITVVTGIDYVIKAIQLSGTPPEEEK